MSDEPHPDDQMQITLSRAVAEAIQRQAYEEGRVTGHAAGYQEGWAACHEELTTGPASVAYSRVDWQARLLAAIAMLLAGMATFFPPGW